MKILKIFFYKTIRRQLIISIVLTHAIMMSVFIYDITNNQKDFLHEESLKQTKNLSSMLSKNAATWVLANDYIGMEELISSVSLYPDLKFAMLIDTQGRVLAHTNKKYLNKFLIDDISKKIINAKKEYKTIILLNSKDVIDVATPIVNGDKLIAWSRVSLLQTNNINTINDVIKKGILYTIIAIFIGAFFAYILSINLTKGLHELILVAKKQISGDKDKRANDSRIDEIGTLSIEINKMLDNIKENELKVQKEIKKNIYTNKLLFKSKQLASMGEMIGNIAHQWRQPLSVISVCVSGFQMQKEYGTLKDEDFDKGCESINKNVQYLSKTIDDFKNYIKGTREQTTFNISENIESFMNLIEGTIKDLDIHVQIDSQKDILIYGYNNELIQCFMNLFNNSKDALLLNKIEEKIILISSKVIDDKLYISFQDNANGIPADIIDKIFEPYFTTKHKSQGTGLGLHMSYKLIVEGMNGTIDVKNKKFRYNNKDYYGALFSIILPIK